MVFVDKWPLKNAKAMVFLKSSGTGINSESGPQNLGFFMGDAHALIYLLKKSRRGRFNVLPLDVWHSC